MADLSGDLTRILPAYWIDARHLGGGEFEVWPEPPFAWVRARGEEYVARTEVDGGFRCPIGDVPGLVTMLGNLRERGLRRSKALPPQ